MQWGKRRVGGRGRGGAEVEAIVGAVHVSTCGKSSTSEGSTSESTSEGSSESRTSENSSEGSTSESTSENSTSEGSSSENTSEGSSSSGSGARAWESHSSTCSLDP